MCGRYAATLPPEMLAELFSLLKTVDVPPPRFNIKPTDPIVAIREKKGARELKILRWGLIPSWVKDLKAFPLLINARADGLLTKPAFRNSLKFQRCIIPADGYFEWMVGPDGVKRPYFITLTDNQPMVFAGLYAYWTGPTGERVESGAIVTVEPNLEISGLHDRMPALLRGDAVDKWLDTDAVSPEEAAALASPPPLGTMRYHAVGKAVGRVDAEGPDLVRPLTPEEAAAEGGSGRPPKKKAAAAGQLDLF